jgi:hypothetical protein
VEELFETTIVEATEETRTDSFAGEAAEDLKLGFAVNQVVHLGAVDTEK